MYGKAYDSQKEEKTIDQWEIATQWGQEPIKNAVNLEIMYCIQIPESWSKRKKEKHLFQPCLTRPDIDNYLKFTLDTMNGIVFDDDSQVYFVGMNKIYSDKPRTEIDVRYGANMAEDRYE